MPTIDNIEPAYGPLNQLVTINGSGFGDTQDDSYVMFSQVSAQITSWSDTMIQATFPAGSQIDQWTVQIGVNVAGQLSNLIPFKIKS